MNTYTSVALLLSAVHFVNVFCYPDGKVSMACDNMLPIHGGYRPQKSLAPYSILVSPTTFKAGDQITVTLQANSSTTFKGFLLQARSVGGDFIVGTFRITDTNSQGLQCGNQINGVANSAVSQTSPAHKSSVSVKWIAPPGSGYIRFRATFVKRFSKFWDEVESQTILPLQISSETCGSEKLCFSNPSGCNPATSASCIFMSSMPATGGGYIFEMSALSTGYVAIGFSNDKLMGNDDIYICVMNTTGSIEIQHAFSTGQTTPNLVPLGTVEGIVRSSDNGVIKCSFIIRNKIATPHGNASSSFYIFLTSGPSQNGRILKHPLLPCITNEKVDLAQLLQVKSSAFQLPIMAKVHGALMLIAWMTTGSIGMVFARYLKNAAKKPICGKATWFQVHQLFMVLTIAATITAFVVIFVEANGWSYWCGAHAEMGCIVMILSFFQPIIALFRPGPDHKWRVIFNWFHAFNAFVIMVLAVATNFLGLQLIDKSSNLWLVKVMGGFVGWEVLTAFILENRYIKQKDSVTGAASEKKIHHEVIVILISVVGNLAFLTALLVGIGLSQ
ncbi:putative ferric-chelate reductase 1 [Lissotriton helveticus]